MESKINETEGEKIDKYLEPKYNKGDFILILELLLNILIKLVNLY